MQSIFKVNSGVSAPPPEWHTKQMNLPKVLFRVSNGGFGHRFFMRSQWANDWQCM